MFFSFRVSDFFGPRTIQEGRTDSIVPVRRDGLGIHLGASVAGRCLLCLGHFQPFCCYHPLSSARASPNFVAAGQCTSSVGWFITGPKNFFLQNISFSCLQIITINIIKIYAKYFWN